MGEFLFVSAAIGLTFIVSRTFVGCGFRTAMRATRGLLIWHSQRTRLFVSRRLEGRNGVCGPRWMQPVLRPGSYRQLRSKPSPPAVAHAPRRIGSTRNSLRGSWHFDQTQGANCHMGNCAFSEPWHQNVRSLSRRARDFWRRSRRMRSWERMGYSLKLMLS